jgi:hypothetical protein
MLHSWLKACKMIAQLDEIKCISFAGFKKVWRVGRSQGDIIECEGCDFIRVCPSSYSLTALVLEANPLVDDNTVRSISSSIGYASLVKLRNEEQARLLQAIDGSENVQGCTLFDGPPAKKPRRLIKRSQPNTALATRASLEIEILVDGQQRSVRLLKPLHHMGNVFVECTPTAIGRVVQHLRDSGFDDSSKLRVVRDASLPKGIRATKGGKFLVLWKKDNGKLGNKTVNNLDDAICFQSNPTSTDGAGEDDDAPHEGESGELNSAAGSEAGLEAEEDSEQASIAA